RSNRRRPAVTHRAIEQLEDRCLLSGPTANGDMYDGFEDTTLDIPKPGVLSNDSPSNPLGSLAAQLVTPTSNGHVSLSSDGSFTYVPNASFVGFDRFSYRAIEGSAISNLAIVTIHVAAPNTPPSFDPIPDQTIDEDAYLQTITITGVSSGAGSEAPQLVSFRAISSNPAIVPNPTVVEGSGPSTRILSYTPAPNA